MAKQTGTKERNQARAKKPPRGNRRASVKEARFYNILRDIFVGAKVEGESGYINLMKIKSRYYEKGVFPKLKEDIEEALKEFPEFREELFDKLYTFFGRYFSESGSIFFQRTPLHQNIYDRVYTDDKDVMLFWKTHMLYYVKTDRLFRNLEVELEGLQFFFDVSTLEHKKAMEKREIVHEFKTKRKDGTLVFDVAYSERGRKTRVDKILRELRKQNVKVSQDILERAFQVFARQSEVDYFINKNAKAFLWEQFNLWLHQYVFAGESEWTETRIKQLQTLKDIAFKIIDFISQFEDELVKVWNKPKFVLNSNYVITLDRIAESDMGLVERLLRHEGFKSQVEEWRQLGIVGDSFRKEAVVESNLMGKQLNDKYCHLPVDTRYFKDLELEVLGLFENLDEALDGWLIKSENYQALNTLKLKFRKRIQCIYIDPPFNAKTSEIPYVNKYKHSSWMSMIENRLAASKDLLDHEFVYIVAVDDVEQKNLGSLLELIFPDCSLFCVTVIHNRRGQQGKDFSSVHEYAYFVFPDDQTKYIKQRNLDKPDHRQLRDSGTESHREDAKNCFYPILVKHGQIIGFGDVASDDFHPEGVNEHLKNGVVRVWPIDTNGNERKWRYARQSVEDIVQDLEVKVTSQGIQIYYNKTTGTARTVWDSEKYDASEHGTKVLQHLFGDEITDVFQYPKSVFLVEDSIDIALPLGGDSSIILDFFAGSGTTAHAVININRSDGGKRKYILVEMADYFGTVILPRIKKVVFSDNWKAGKAEDGEGISHFIKYYALEQYEATLRKAKYEDADLFDDPYRDPYNQYVFLRDLKMLEALEVDLEQDEVKVDLSRLYDNIDIAETLSNLRGKSIKKITPDFVEFEDGEKVDFKNLDYRLIKPLIWW